MLAFLYGEVGSSHGTYMTGEVAKYSSISNIQGFFLFPLLGRYPDFLQVSTWAGLAIHFVSLFASSFATQVRALELVCSYFSLLNFRSSRCGTSFSFKVLASA